MKEQITHLTLDQMKAKVKLPNQRMLRMLTSRVRGGEGGTGGNKKPGHPFI